MRLTPNMRETLQRARNGPLRRTHEPAPGQPAWPAPWQTLAALGHHELLAPGETRNRKGYRVQTWTITDAGRDALTPVVRVARDRVLFLADRAKSLTDYTSDPGKRIDDLEAVNPAEVDAVWFGQAAERHAAAQDRRTAARAVRQHARRAA